MSHLKHPFEVVALTLAAFFTVGYESMANEQEFPVPAGQIYEELQTESEKENPEDFNLWIRDNPEKASEMIKKYHAIQEFHELLPYDVKEELDRYVKSIQDSEEENEDLEHSAESVQGGDPGIEELQRYLKSLHRWQTIK